MQRWVVACALAFLLCAAASAKECPNGLQCKDGLTCCPHPEKQYECCKLDQTRVECCGDRLYCCPAGMMCDQDKSLCMNATHSLPWTEETPKEPSTHSKSYRMIKSYKGEEEDIICPDQSRCPPEFSCLRALTKYGCCPMPEGIPCSDGKHCCPKGHSCSEDSRSCIKKDVTSPVLCSDGVSECPEESSCCEGADGQFGCCPMKQAVCCDDKVHCCPEGTVCDPESSKCLSVLSKKQLPMWAKFPARRRAEWEDQKEEQQVTAEAPAGSENIEDKVDNGVTASPDERVSDVKCDNSTEASCPDGSTCCLSGEGHYGCCPGRNAICCKDHKHCCPHFTTCDLEHMRCLRASNSHTTPMSRKIVVFTTVAKVETQVTEPEQEKHTESEEEEEDEDVEGRQECKGHKNHFCHKHFTCCGHHHCCPLHNATCCGRGRHCCPHGYTCQNHTCAKDGVVIPWYTAIRGLPDPQPQGPDSAVSPAERASNVSCNSTAACPDETTCCETTEGGWGCCPAPNAVCCSDHLHCCPHGMTCDVAQGTCQEASSSQTTPMIRKIPAVTIAAPFTAGETQVTGKVQSKQTDTEEEEEDDEDVDHSAECEGHKHCPKNATLCCPGRCHTCKCCPLPKPRCCGHKHCCPHGYKCCHRRHKCVKPGVEIPWYTKTPALDGPEPVDDVESQVTEVGQFERTKSNDDEDDDNDKEHKVGYKNKCSGNATYCGHNNGFCCPYSHATCCKDHAHCCPHGYKCNLKHRKCVKSGVEIPWYTKSPALDGPKPVDVEIQVTEVGRFEWEMSKGKDGDDDGEDDDDIEHRVDCTSPTCTGNITCCGPQQQFCCPHPKATCCFDGQHCCPHGFKCRLGTWDCVKDGLEIPQYITVPALNPPELVYAETQVKITEVELTVSEEEEETVDEYDSDDDDGDDEDYFEDEDDDEDEEQFVRCDGNATCPKGSSCCKCGDHWGCCPLPHAKCCSDGKHCCPHHYKCSESEKACVRDDDVVIPWYPKLPALSNLETPSEKEVTCPDGSSCPDGSTCCKIDSGYGCCPLPNAVCCPDEQHCCPEGYTCDGQGATCQMSVVLKVEYVPLTKAKSEPKGCGRNVCLDSEKCCMNRGMPHCCNKQHTCCDVGNCCPPGLTCDGKGGCKENNVSFWDKWRSYFFQRVQDNQL